MGGALIAIYSRLLERIEQSNYDVFRRRVRLPLWEKSWIVWRALVGSGVGKLLIWAYRTGGKSISTFLAVNHCPISGPIGPNGAVSGSGRRSTIYGYIVAEGIKGTGGGS